MAEQRVKPAVARVSWGHRLLFTAAMGTQLAQEVISSAQSQCQGNCHGTFIQARRPGVAESSQPPALRLPIPKGREAVPVSGRHCGARFKPVAHHPTSAQSLCFTLTHREGFPWPEEAWSCSAYSPAT